MRRLVLLGLILGAFGARAESLRCVADSSAPYRFGFDAAGFKSDGPISAKVVVPGLFGHNGRHTGQIELALLAPRSRTGYLDYEGTISDFYRRYSAKMWLNPERQDQMGRFRGLITIQMKTEVQLPLICRLKP